MIPIPEEERPEGWTDKQELQSLLGRLTLAAWKLKEAQDAHAEIVADLTAYLAGNPEPKD